MYNLETLTTAVSGVPEPETWFKSQCVKSCPAKGATADCINNDGTNTGCESTEFYGTELQRTYCLPSKKSAKAIMDIL